MRFMMIVKATGDSEAGVVPGEELLASMARYHEELQRAGVLLDASGLKPSSKGWRIRYSGDRRTLVDGPFTEAKELVAGYTLIQVKSREEASCTRARVASFASSSGRGACASRSRTRGSRPRCASSTTGTASAADGR